MTSPAVHRIEAPDGVCVADGEAVVSHIDKLYVSAPPEQRETIFALRAAGKTELLLFPCHDDPTKLTSVIKGAESHLSARDC